LDRGTILSIYISYKANNVHYRFYLIPLHPILIFDGFYLGRGGYAPINPWLQTVGTGESRIFTWGMSDQNFHIQTG